MTARSAASVRTEPFRHATCFGLLPNALLEGALAWMEGAAPWSLRVESFYEQWELSLSPATLPASLLGLVSPGTVACIGRQLVAPIHPGEFRFVEATAHKLVAGQTIRIHNDYLEAGETTRVLVQVNRGWHDDQGGLLMLFGSGSPDDVRRIVRPVHGSALGFEISPSSFHAVSRVASGDRFTLVYSFSSRETVG